MTSMVKQTIKIRKTNILFWLLTLLMIATILIMYANPIKDGDIFFHLTYGKTIIEDHTMTPDHSIYSWTDADADQIYCAWLGQAMLYLIYQAGGFDFLFLIKYLCLFLALGIIWQVLRKHRFSDIVFPILLLLLAAIGSYAGMFLKPEIFSMIFMAITAFLYFQAKLLLYKELSYKLLFAFPLLFLLWINTHGVWIFGMIIFTIMLTGEFLNKFIGSKDSFNPVLFKYLSISYLITLLTLLINPYGWAYAISPIPRILQTILPSLFANNKAAGLTQITAYNNLFTTINNPSINLISVWVVMICIFILLYGYHASVNKSWDCTILLLNIALAFLFFRYTRSSYYWGPFWCMSCFFLNEAPKGQSLFNKSKFKSLMNFSMIGLILFFSILTIYKSIYFPPRDNWLGFGLNNYAPVDESIFLKKNRPGKKLFNSYKTGAYLMFDLYPDFKVFIDARRFPYIELIDEYMEFKNSTAGLDKFNKKYPFDTALVDYSYDNLFIKFFNSKKWEPIYYGATAAIFAKKPLKKAYNYKDTSLERFNRLGNLKNAGKVFTIAMNFNDIEAAYYILNHIKSKFKHLPGYQRIITGADNKLEGLKAYENKQYDTAYHLLNQSNDKTIVSITEILIKLRIYMARQFAGQKKYPQALGLIEQNLKQLPNHPEFLYTAGVLAYFSQDGSRESIKSFKLYFTKFLSLHPNHAHAKIARQVLEGREGLSIPLGL